MTQRILPSDRPFLESPDVGHPDCLCSRCEKMIGEAEVPIRVWPADRRYEYRFHQGCFGIYEPLEVPHADPA